MKTIKLIPICLILAMFFAVSCSKEAGVGGKKTISGSATYPGGTPDGAVVSISYGATDASGEVSATTVVQSGTYKFEGLEPGDYFIDATYTDKYGISFNTAGYSVTLGKDDATVDIELK